MATIITAQGSYYYQLQQVFAIGQDPAAPIEIPQCTYSFVQNSHTGEFLREELDDAQQADNMEQAQDLVNTMRTAPNSDTLEYIQTTMAEELRCGQGWLAQQH